MKFLFASAYFLSFSFLAKAQTSNESIFLADTIKKYFNYEELNSVLCSEVPVGIYSLSFKVNSNGKLNNIKFSNDSLPVLRDLLVKALVLSAEKVRIKKMKTIYLQLFYFTNILGCNNSDDTSINSPNIYVELSKLLSNQIEAVEKTFKNSIKKTSKYLVLTPVTITNKNPNRKQVSKGFYNDSKQGNQKDIPKEKMEQIEKEVKRKNIEKKEN
jgi:hypothetical protein